jgi:hypothetical protein
MQPQRKATWWRSCMWLPSYAGLHADPRTHVPQQGSEEPSQDVNTNDGMHWRSAPYKIEGACVVMVRECAAHADSSAPVSWCMKVSA